MGEYLHKDPAVEKWVRMRESTAQHFRWSPRNIRSIGLLGLVVPAGLLYLSVEYDRKFNWAAKRPTATVKAEEDA
ncbi:hypothetical protein DFQ27_002925 [Actinomortierella ambigua]|uniref:NADH-ubiquinone oxidoreductase B15 subunit n=1 Tax=Actinomortierella ambigua TaxID=1343610 RepID=A0A9P6Q912_9FUNG|nr:hypothetical protein DFQ26_006414 [Actinomortierella ambigua]KAG0261493.1 hypothetical protein DFQ27_002925 [Actinomortierella ambigua]